MVVLSKMQVIRGLASLKSCTLIHFSGNESCLLNLIQSFINSGFSCAKYYIPVYILQLALIGFDKLDRTKMKNIFFGFIRSTIYGAGFPVALNGTICLYNACFHNINIGTIYLVCFMIGATIFIESKRNRHLNSYMIGAITLEVLIHELASNNIITRSPVRDTFKFMIINGLVMYYLAQKKVTSLNFWFYKVESISANKKEIECRHQESCWTFIMKGFRKYFVIGFGWNIIKLLLTKLSVMMKRPETIPLYLFKSQNFKFGAVLGFYAVIYRYVTCNLLQIDGYRRAAHSLLAGTLAGCTYIIEPNLQFGVTAIITLIQIFYERFQEKTFSKNTWEKIPSGELAFITVVPYLIISYLANSKEFNKTNANFIFNTFTANNANKLKVKIWEDMNITS